MVAKAEFSRTKGRLPSGIRGILCGSNPGAPLSDPGNNQKVEPVISQGSIKDNQSLIEPEKEKQVVVHSGYIEFLIADNGNDTKKVKSYLLDQELNPELLSLSHEVIGGFIAEIDYHCSDKTRELGKREELTVQKIRGWLQEAFLRSQPDEVVIFRQKRS